MINLGKYTLVNILVLLMRLWVELVNEVAKYVQGTKAVKEKMG